MDRIIHRKLIDFFVLECQNLGKKIPQDIGKIFKEAGDFVCTLSSPRKRPQNFAEIETNKYSEGEMEPFADDILNAVTDTFTEDEFFFCHFYYNIECKNNVIELSRSGRNDYSFDNKMDNCDSIRDGKLHKAKEFYTFINDFFQGDDRTQYLKGKGKNKSNRSNCVAFLHAMGAELGETVSETPSLSRTFFEEHLRKCFAEYLFLKDEAEALFMLGIAMHGIMDSFTPSHMGFQHYSDQDKNLHAQGDIVPIRCNSTQAEQHVGATVQFNPGKSTYKESRIIDFTSTERSIGKTIDSVIGRDYISSQFKGVIEYCMLKIFLYISKIRNKRTKELIANKENIEQFWKSLNGKSLQQVNNILLDYEYSDDSYIYSDSAKKTMINIYNHLSQKRCDCQNSYQHYKEAKKSIQTAVDFWKNEYDKIQTIRDEHINLHLYDKDQLRDIVLNSKPDLFLLKEGIYRVANINDISGTLR